jgi:hypothetical protein
VLTNSIGAAASLKYAKAQDLPSYPVVGIDTKSSASAAALLANKNTKSPEWWKPEHSSAAGKAALLANGYKMAPLWQPEASAAGSKAALLAHRDGGKLNFWHPEATAEGHSAATIAMRKKPGPEVDYGYTDQGRKNAFTAATDAVSASRRRRAQSVPAPAEIGNKPPVQTKCDLTRSMQLRHSKLTHKGRFSVLKHTLREKQQMPYLLQELC